MELHPFSHFYLLSLPSDSMVGENSDRNHKMVDKQILKMEDVGIFGMIDYGLATELGVEQNVYVDVIDNKCTHWEAVFIVTVFLNERNDKKQKAKEIFFSKLNS